jgi:hypothetical protein
MRGVDRVFADTNFFAAADVLTEYRQGADLLAAAREAGVDRFIRSSLDAAATLTGGANPVPHYDTKAAVAAHINPVCAGLSVKPVRGCFSGVALSTAAG